MTDNKKKTDNTPNGIFDGATSLSGNFIDRKSNIDVLIEVRNSMPAPNNPRRNNEDNNNED
jgi:hypothetical protein